MGLEAWGSRCLALEPLTLQASSLQPQATSLLYSYTGTIRTKAPRKRLSREADVKSGVKPVFEAIESE